MCRPTELAQFSTRYYHDYSYGGIRGMDYSPAPAAPAPSLTRERPDACVTRSEEARALGSKEEFELTEVAPKYAYVREQRNHVSQIATLVDAALRGQL